MPTSSGSSPSSAQPYSTRLDSEIFQASLPDLLSTAVKYSPCQGPIETFVHHNTLPCHESKSFHEAVVIGRQRFGAEGYLSEDQYLELLQSGRISKTALEDIINIEFGESSSQTLAGLSSVRQIRTTLLLKVLQCYRANE